MERLVLQLPPKPGSGRFRVHAAQWEYSPEECCYGLAELLLPAITMNSTL